MYFLRSASQMHRAAMTDTAAMTWLMRKLPTIRLSVRRPSTKKRSAPYHITYIRISSPWNLRRFIYAHSRKKPSRHQMDSYKNVGCTGRDGSTATPCAASVSCTLER